jgi:hypothetical protein
MQRTLLTGVALLIAASAAVGRPATYAMTCAEAQALVAAAGAIVMSTGQYTYKRFVVHRGFCIHGEYIERVYAPTSDHPQCRVGYECIWRRNLRLRQAR